MSQKHMILNNWELTQLIIFLSSWSSQYRLNAVYSREELVVPHVNWWFSLGCNICSVYQHKYLIRFPPFWCKPFFINQERTGISVVSPSELYVPPFHSLPYGKRPFCNPCSAKGSLPWLSCCSCVQSGIVHIFSCSALGFLPFH